MYAIHIIHVYLCIVKHVSVTKSSSKNSTNLQV